MTTKPRNGRAHIDLRERRFDHQRVRTVHMKLSTQQFALLLLAVVVAQRRQPVVVVSPPRALPSETP